MKNGQNKEADPGKMRPQIAEEQQEEDAASAVDLDGTQQRAANKQQAADQLNLCRKKTAAERRKTAELEAAALQQGKGRCLNVGE